jgi:hypothetical protein
MAGATTDRPRRRLRLGTALAALGAALALLAAACDVPVAPAGKLYDAWKANDPATAHTVATNTAVAQMFASPWKASTGWFFSTCQGAAGSTYCNWLTGREGRMTLRVDNASQKVVSVSRVPLDSSIAGAFFHDWRTGASAHALTYGTTSARNTLFAIAYHQSDHWLPDGCDGTAGALYCTWYDDHARNLTLKVSTAIDPQKVVEVTLTT